MTTESKEQLSSFMDGEIGHDSARFLVRRLSADGNLRDTWSRYHVIRDCLRQQDGEFVSQDLRERVHGALADEPVPAPASRRSRWVRSAVGTAIAASVALAAVLVVGPDRSLEPQPTMESASQQPAAEPFVSPNIGGPMRSTQPVNLSGTESQSDGEIDAYLLRHYQVTGGAGGRGFVSFVPVVVTRGAVEQTEPAKTGDNREADAVRQ
ncbi:sigma-E factor negative regulatory protein [Elongatibacter sediminis]|uniref:Sigma-E factor negative regulatory protein n=1 Tax=Elongatibacter sediminis TaxID=3119006 RepID=A0AAW9R6U4_9GAMM